jgi:mono/diheme cytochrome c family protein
MVATAAFVIAFVVLGFSVFLVAMGGGPKTAREQLLHRQGRAASRSSGLIITVVIAAFGIAIPAVVLAVNADDSSKNAPGGVELKAGEENGREIFADLCSTCHTLGASNAVGKVGPNLDELRPPKELTLNALAKGRANGRGQMPAELVDGEDAEDVADYIVAVAGHE